MMQMKDSGIEWIGVIPESWKIARLKDIAANEPYSIVDGPFGTAISTSDYKKTGVPLVRIVNLNETELRTDNFVYITDEHAGKVARSRFYKNDIIFAKTGATVGKCALNTNVDSGILSSSCVKIRISEKFYRKFFYYFFNTNQFNEALRMACNGTTRDTINLNPFSCLNCLVPSFKEQQAISTYLDRQCAHINDIIEKTQASIEEYKKLRQAVISQAVTNGIRHNRLMKKSGIEWVKEIPTDWSVIPAKYLFKNSDVRKQVGDEQMTASQQYGIISQAQYMELTGSKIVFANKGIDDWKHVEPFDFIISLRSFQGGLEMSETTGCITWHYIVLKPCKEIYSYYFKWLFKSELYIKALQRTCNFIRDGQDLRYSNFIQVPLFEPSLEEQKEIADYLNVKCAEIDKIIEKKKGFLAALESYKKSMIYEYVTGKKEVTSL